MMGLPPRSQRGALWPGFPTGEILALSPPCLLVWVPHLDPQMRMGRASCCLDTAHRAVQKVLDPSQVVPMPVDVMQQFRAVLVGLVYQLEEPLSSWVSTYFMSLAKFSRSAPARPWPSCGPGPDRVSFPRVSSGPSAAAGT